MILGSPIIGTLPIVGPIARSASAASMLGSAAQDQFGNLTIGSAYAAGRASAGVGGTVTVAKWAALGLGAVAAIALFGFLREAVK